MPVTALAFANNERDVLAISTCCAYKFVPTGSSFGDKCSGFFKLSIWIFVLAVLVKYLAVRFKIISN